MPETCITLSFKHLSSAADRNRTGTGITTHGILSPGRLPVPPLRRTNWMEVDSNHRSNLQQIYSLSPLATRESIHMMISHHKADDRTRTDNLLITNQLLCQLSHIGVIKIRIY